MFNIRTRMPNELRHSRAKWIFISHWSVIRSLNHAGILCQHTHHQMQIKSILNRSEQLHRDGEERENFEMNTTWIELNWIACWERRRQRFCRKTARINFLFCGMKWRRAHFNCYRNNLLIFFLHLFSFTIIAPLQPSATLIAPSICNK